MLQLLFSMIDYQAKSDLLSVTANECQPWSNLGDFNYDRLDPPLAMPTNEHNYSLLDGMEEMPDIMPDATWGAWGESISNSHGVYVNPTTVKFPFGNLRKSRGITLHYYSDCGYTAEVSWYADVECTNLLKTGIYETKPEVGVVRETVNNYRCVTVSFVKSSIPFRMVKCWAIDVGIMRIVEDEEMHSCRIFEEIDPTSVSISHNILTATIKTRDSFIAPITSSSFDKMMMKRMQLEIRRDNKLFGIFFLDDLEDVYQNGVEFDLVAYDAVSILDKQPHMGGMYANKPVAELLDEIFELCFPTGAIKYILDPYYENSVVSGWIPAGTCGLALQLIAFALSATVNTSRYGDVRIYPKEEDIKGDSHPMSDDVQPWVNLNDLKSYDNATMLPSNEPNYTLDMDEFPDVKNDLVYGWLTQSMSDGEGRYAIPPKLVIPFDTPHNLVAMTLNFGAYENEYISKLRFTAYDEYDNVLFTNVYNFTSNPSAITERIMKFRKLEFEALESSAPYRFARIAQIDYGRSFHIPLNRQYRKGRDKTTEDVTGVRVMSYKYTPIEETVEAHKNPLPIGMETIMFREPLHSLTISGGSSLVERGANHAIANVVNSNPVVIVGKKYLCEQAVHQINAEAEAGVVENIKLYEGYTLVSPDRASEVAHNIFWHLVMPIRSENAIIFDDDETGLVAQLETYENNVTGIITRLDIDLRNGKADEIEVIGNAWR